MSDSIVAPRFLSVTNSDLFAEIFWLQLKAEEQASVAIKGAFQDPLFEGCSFMATDFSAHLIAYRSDAQAYLTCSRKTIAGFRLSRPHKAAYRSLQSALDEYLADNGELRSFVWQWPGGVSV